MSGHTPAPWVTYTAHDGTRNVRAGNQYVCQFSHLKGAERDTAEADGRLIAAAPGLLASLKEVVAAGRDGWITRDELQRAHDAIAKAEGAP